MQINHKQSSIPLQILAFLPAHNFHSNTHLTALLLRHTNSPSTSSSGLGVLATDTESPVVTETTVSTDLLQAFQIITKFGVDTVGEDLAVLAIDDITLTIEEPGWDLVLGRVLDDGDDPLEFFGGELTSAADISIEIRIRYRLWHTVCAGSRQPSCIPGWSTGDRHPLSW